MLKNHCINIYDEMGCTAAIAFCHNEIQTPFEKLGTFDAYVYRYITHLVNRKEYLRRFQTL